MDPGNPPSQLVSSVLPFLPLVPLPTNINEDAVFGQVLAEFEWETVLDDTNRPDPHHEDVLCRWFEVRVGYAGNVGQEVPASSSRKCGSLKLIATHRQQSGRWNSFLRL